ncbi:Alpha/Beta hydrolase protein [Mycena sp. CBHHK59/15]|nr:Alpha/Beta hydrolase protein [Mycena sp. CBHHK59/15]
MMLLFTFTIALAVAVHCAPATSSLQVNTGSGTLHGFINSSAPAVRQFLGVPFALPPTGARRWLPPAAITNSTPTFNATSFSPSCPQIPLSSLVQPVVYSYKARRLPDTKHLGSGTPASRGATRLRLVLRWRLRAGRRDSLYFNAAPWVQRTQAHVVVTVNFRTNIFGFPNAAGLTEQNLGLLDQRAALEWVRTNIGAFGGDASRIVDWGQSAGAIAVDYLNFAFPEDPIVHGFMMDSGTALYPPLVIQSRDTAQINFVQVATQLGCGLAASQVDCLRGASWQSIETLLSANAGLTFLPIPDERIVFANYTARYAAGAFARVPALIGTNEHEFNAIIPHVPGVPFNDTLSDGLTNATFLCTAAATTQLRQAHGLATYRYRYDGDFPNISPPAFPGAYHAAELPLIFGTAGQYHGESTAYENEVSMKLQDLWLDFARDPQLGLQGAGWNSYGAGKAVLLGDADTPVKQIDVQQLDDICTSGLLPGVTSRLWSIVLALSKCKRSPAFDWGTEPNFLLRQVQTELELSPALP